MAPPRQVVIGDDAIDPFADPLTDPLGGPTGAPPRGLNAYYPELGSGLQDAPGAGGYTSSPAGGDDYAYRAWLVAQRDLNLKQYEEFMALDDPLTANRFYNLSQEFANELKALEGGRTKSNLIAAPSGTPGWYDPETGEYITNDFYSPSGAGGSWVAGSTSTPGWVNPLTGETRSNPFFAGVGGGRQPSFVSASTSTPGWMDPVTGQMRANPYYVDPAIAAAEKAKAEAAALEAQRAWQMAEAQRDREAAMARQQLSTAGSLAGMLDQGAQFAIPRQIAPGQTHFPGFEPGGPYQQLALRSGGRPVGDTGRVVPVHYDPAASWEQARRLLGIGG